MAERKHHGEAKAVASQQVLVEQQDAYIGRKPALTSLPIGAQGAIFWRATHMHHVESTHYACQSRPLDCKGMLVGLKGCSPYGNDDDRPQDWSSGPLQ